MRYGWRVRQAFPSGEWLAEIWEADDEGAEVCIEQSPEFPFRAEADTWGLGRAEECAEQVDDVNANEITWVDA